MKFHFKFNMKIILKISVVQKQINNSYIININIVLKENSIFANLYHKFLISSIYYLLNLKNHHYFYHVS